MHSGHVGSFAGSNKWAYSLSSGVCPDRRRVRRTASAGSSRRNKRFQRPFGSCWTRIGEAASDEGFRGVK